MADIRAFQGKAPSIAEDVWVDPTAVIIGEVELGTGCSIWPQVVIRGDIHHIKIGTNTNIQDGSVVHVTHDSRFNPGGYPTIIGNNVTVGHKVMLHGCTIGDNCLIGMGAVVMDGAVIEPRVVLGAGSLVPGGKVLDGGYLWHGSPVRKVRELNQREQEFLDYLAANYFRLSQQYREE
ncbi:MAG: gamma carbonic anhydrase family protein [Gammaproteobacteria bacterium]|nr:gamma carbonic anhydrase family protein [Gammaproteobacteria bacterium]